MATSIRTHFVGGDENELTSQKLSSQSVTRTSGEGGPLVKLWNLVNPRVAAARDMENASPLEKRGAGLVPRIPSSWSEVINDPVLWKELRELELDDADDYPA